MSVDAQPLDISPGQLARALSLAQKYELKVNGVPVTMDDVADAAFRARLAQRFPRVWLDDIKPDTTNNDLIKGIIGRKSLVLVYGPAGDGKTFFTIDLVAHIACGQPWRGLRGNQCAAVYVAAEAGASILRRFIPWRERHLSEAREARSPLAIITRGPNLLKDLDVEALTLEVRTVGAELKAPVELVAFDTFSRSTPGGDENSASDVTRAIAAADYLRDELGVTTLFVHHSGKDAAKGARGHSSLFAAADTVISVIERVATVEKARDGITGERFAFDLELVTLGEDQDGDQITTCLVVPVQAAPARPQQQPLSGVAKVALQALQEAVSAHGQPIPETTTIPGGVRAVRIEQWREQFVIRYGSDGADGKRDGEAVRKAFQRGREALLKASAVGISNPYCWPIRRPL